MPIVPLVLCLLPLPAGAALYRHLERRSRARWASPAALAAAPEEAETTALQGPYRGRAALVRATPNQAPAPLRRAAAGWFATASLATSASLASLFLFGWFGVLALPIGAFVAWVSIRAGTNVLEGRTGRVARAGVPPWLEKALEKKRARLPASS